MKVFSGKDYTDMPNPDPGKVYRPEILTQKDEAKDLAGIFGLLPPQTPGMLHYHNKRESILIILSGEGIETVEGKDTTVKAGDVLFIPPGKAYARQQVERGIPVSWSSSPTRPLWPTCSRGVTGYGRHRKAGAAPVGGRTGLLPLRRR